VLTENGWPQCGSGDCEHLLVPGTSDVRIELHAGAVATVLTAWASWFHRTVRPIDVYKPRDYWGWASPEDEAQQGVPDSNHCSGTAADLCATAFPWHKLCMPPDQVGRVRHGLKLFENTVYWGRDWGGEGQCDEMHFQVGYNMYGNPAFADFARRLRSGYLNIYGPEDPTAFPLPVGYYYGPLDGPDHCISCEYDSDLPAWKDGLGRWQAVLGLPITKKWNDGMTPKAATTLQLQKGWPSTDGIYGTVHQSEWDAVMKEGWRLPPNWDSGTVKPPLPQESNDFPLPAGYYYGPIDGPDESISCEYAGDLPVWKDGLGRWQAALGLTVTKKWNDGVTPKAATALQLQKGWPTTDGIYGTVHQGEWDAVMKEGWRLPPGWDRAPVQSPPSSRSKKFPLPPGYYYGPIDGPQESISCEYESDLQAWKDGLGRWQAALGLTVTKKWNDGVTPKAATTLQLQKGWPTTNGIYGTVHQGEWDAVMKEGWRLPAGWDPSTVQPPAPPISSAAAIPVSEVRYEREGFAEGCDAFRGYVNKTLDLMGITDPSARDNWMRGLLTAAQRESSYRPSAINTVDSNSVQGPMAADGWRSGCSRGLMQCISSTFAGFHQPGTSTNIYDPVANVAAAMNYVMGPRYDVSRDGSNLAANVQQFDPNRPPKGY